MIGESVCPHIPSQKVLPKNSKMPSNHTSIHKKDFSVEYPLRGLLRFLKILTKKKMLLFFENKKY